MEKKEKKADLAQLLSKLLNDLLRMWWKPFNRNKTLHIGYYDKCKWLNYKWIHLDGWFMNEESRTLRELVSKESGLWQFVCANKLITNSIKMREAREHDIDDYSNILIMYDPYEYQFRLIESALKDESELESFLLENIKVE